MSGSEVSEMDVDYQSEDGEIKIQKSPLDKEKHNEDILSFSLSEEDDADDTADSLDIKPPQATVIHSYKSRSHREKRSHRDKERRTFGHSSHVSRGESLSTGTSHKKSHHHSREHRERREERHREREKRHHRDKHAAPSESKRDRADYGVDERIRDSSRSVHRDEGFYRGREETHGSKAVVVSERVTYSETRVRETRDGRETREPREGREIREPREAREYREHREPRETREPRENRDHRESRSRDENRPETRVENRTQEKAIEDLREQLIDKRRSDQETRDRARERDRRGRKRERRDGERVAQQPQQSQQQQQQPQQQTAQQSEKEQEPVSKPLPKEPVVKKDKVERDLRREKLLEADREIARQKEVYRRELEARRARRHLEEEKQRTLESIAKKRERSLDRERKRRRGDGEDAGDEDDDDESIEKIDSDDSVKEILVDDEPKGKLPIKDGGHSSEEESHSSSEGSTEEGEESDETESGGGRASDEERPRRNGTDERGDNEMNRSASDTDSDLSHPEENGKQASPAASPLVSPPAASPPAPVDPFEGLPQYLPAIQGCRSVEEFQCLNRIEEGTYGVVYRARDKRTDEIVALKRLKMEKEKEGFPITSLREINTLLKAQHKNIVTVREIVVGSNMDKIFIVMDYVEHDLKSLMETMRHKKQAFSAGEVKCLMQQLLRAVSHLHDNWILHRDLKTSNLLLSHKGILKVGDFGLAREYGSPLKAYTPIVVTLWYRSPELLLCTKEYSTPVDMWSVGCIFAEFLLMEALFPGKSEIDQLNRIFKELGTPNERQWPGFNKLPAVQKMNFTDYPVNQLRTRFGAVLSESGIDLLNKFLTYDPVKRVTAEDAQQHQYFNESPVAIDPAMFPTWPAKSELGHRKAAASPKPPSGGKEYKQLGEGDEDVPIGGFHMGAGLERSRVTVGAGFSLKF